MFALAAIFTVAAAVVWVAGSRLARYVDEVTDRFHVGKASAGMLLLGGVTSLPEVAAVSTSAATGNASLAINNLLGTASINLVLLAIADAVYGRGALTRVAAAPATLMQGVLSMLIAALAALVATAGDFALFGVGAGSMLIAAVALAGLWITSRFERRRVWEVVRSEDGGAEQARVEPEADGGTPREREEPDGDSPRGPSTPRLIGATVLAAVTILVAGLYLSLTADAIARKTGVSAGLVGFVLVGLSTSLPEISSITAAVRLRQYEMAAGDVFGTNLFNYTLILLADAIYAGEPVLAQSGKFEVIGATLTILLTGAYVVGLLERNDRTVLRMGYDSIAALLMFAVGLSVLSRFVGQ